MGRSGSEESLQPLHMEAKMKLLTFGWNSSNLLSCQPEFQLRKLALGPLLTNQIWWSNNLASINSYQDPFSP